VDISRKKKLAREFLLFLLTFIICGLTYLTIIIYNSLQQKKSNDLLEEIAIHKSTADSLVEKYNQKVRKQKWYFNKYNKVWDMSDSAINSYQKWWKHNLKFRDIDTLSIAWSTIWNNEQIAFEKSIGFESPKSLNKFLIDNSISSIDIQNRDSARMISKEIESMKSTEYKARYSIIEPPEQLLYTVYAFLISIGALFVLRYLFYAVRWSVRTLQEK
jgi:hypothetical protein